MMTTTLKEAFYFFRHNLNPLLAYTLFVGILVVILPQFLNSFFTTEVSVGEEGQQTIQPVVQIMNLIIQPIYFGGLIVMIYSLAMGQAKSITNCLMSALIRWPYLFLANIITSVMIIGGFLLLIIPGIWLFSRLFLVPFLVLLKQQTPFQAIINSYQMTRGYSLTILTDIIFLVILFVFFIVFLNFLQILHPLLLLLLILLFQSLANVVYYRHYEILLGSDQKESPQDHQTL